MGSISQAPLNHSYEAEEASEPPGPTSERTRTSERRIPSARDTMSTLPELEGDDDFEPHDTIPAPPWLEEV